MSPARDPAPEDPDLLSIPRFLRREAKPGSKTPARTAAPRSKPRPLPPESMMPVLRAIRRDRDTMQKLRKSLGTKFTDREIRDGLAALMRIASIRRVGRRYLPVTGKPAVTRRQPK